MADEAKLGWNLYGSIYVRYGGEPPYSSHFDGVGDEGGRQKKADDGKKSPTSATRGPERPDNMSKNGFLLDTRATKPSNITPSTCQNNN